MKKTAFTICMLLSIMMSVSMMASPRTRQQALQIAQSQAQSLGVLTQAQVSTDKDNAPYFVFNNDNDKGWTIVSGDDRMPEVLAYSDEGSLDMDNLPEALQDILNDVENYYNNLDVQENTATASVKAPRKAAQSTASAIGPLLTTKWDQFKPYYNLTPTVNGSQCATGCVATAFAQILYYLYHIKNGQSSTTFDNTIPTYTPASGTAGAAVEGPRTYNWDKMVSDYASGYTEEQATAIATLMRDCGTAFQMKYAVGGSTCNAGNPYYYSATYFGIASDSLSYLGTETSTDAWHTVIDKELNLSYPVQLGGNGHAFVCDGRDATGEYYHFNFGYSGRGNGFYSFDAVLGYNTSGSMRYTTGIRIANDTPISAFEELKIKYNAAVATAALEPVGTIAGQYQKKYYDALQALLTTAQPVIEGTTTMSDAEMKTLGEKISDAEQTLTYCRTPYANGIYYIKNYYNYDPQGESFGAMYASGTSIKYGTLDRTNDAYKWELEYDEENNGYYIKNVSTGTYISSVGNYTSAKLSSSKSVSCEVWPTNLVPGTTDYTVSIRPMCSGYRSDNCHYLNYYQPYGSTIIVGWEPYNDYSMWVLEASLPMAESSFESDAITLEKGSTATNKFTTTSDGTVTYSSADPSVATVDSKTGVVTGVAAGKTTIKATIPMTEKYSGVYKSYDVTVTDAELEAKMVALIKEAEGLYTAEELEAAKNAGTTTRSDALITASTQFSSPYTETSEGSFANLLDGKSTTFWHSKWSGGSVTPGTHYFDVKLNEAHSGDIQLSMTRRSNATSDHITSLKIQYSTDGTTYTDLTTVDLPYGSSSETVTAEFTLPVSCQYIRFYIASTTTGRGYGHMSEFQLYPVTHTYRSALQEAMLKVDEALTAAKDETTQATYDALKDAVDAFKDAVASIDMVNANINENVDNNIYNISGQRISSARRGQIIIRNGKKIIVK